MLRRSGILFCVIGPAGSGKTSICDRLVAEYGQSVAYSTSSTTRTPREGEVHGKSYFFMNRPEFESARERGEFFEWEEVHGNLYGTRLDTLTQSVHVGKDLLLAIDIRGALKIKQSFPADSVTVFLSPPSWKDLIQRVTNRGAVSKTELAARLETARREYRMLLELPGESSLVDYLIVNRDFERTYNLVSGILEAERLRLHRLDRKSIEDLCRIEDDAG